jgi:phosphatidylinositol-3-phosphatase
MPASAVSPTRRVSRRPTSSVVRLASLAAGAILALTLTASTSAIAGAGLSVPADASAGSTITVTGYGFAAGQTGHLTYNGGVVTGFIASAAGSFSVPFTIPDGVGPGAMGRISAKDGASRLLATTLLLISASDAPPAYLTVPRQTSLGSTIDVVGTYFAAGQSGFVTLNGLPVATFLAAWDGSFDVPVAIPATTAIGTDRISAKDPSFALIATTTIVVGAAVSPTPSPTPAGSAQPSAAPSALSSPTPGPTPVGSAQPSDAPSPSLTPLPPSPSPIASDQPTDSPSPAPPPTPLPSPIATVQPSAAPSSPVPSPTAPATGLPNFTHVYVIVFENAEYSSIVGSSSAPYINSLIGTYGLATSYDAVSHPSEPNYIAMTSGGTQGVIDDGVYNLGAPSLFDQVEASGRTWRAYQQGYPGNCFTGDSSASVADGAGLPGAYVRRHDPAISYSSISGNPARCGNIASLAGFDPAAASLEFITPNLVNDMHDGTVADGDNFLKSFLPQITGSPAFANSVVFVTFDEGVSNVGGGGHVVTLAITPNMTPGFKAGDAYSHYSMLRTIEQAWGLPFLGNAASASAMVFPY